MSVDWQATARLLVFIALGVVVLGMLVGTVADVSLRKRARAGIVGPALMGGGFLTASAMMTATDGDAVTTIGWLLAATMLIPAAVTRNRLTARLAYGGAAISLFLHGRTAWLNDEVDKFLWTSGIAVGAVVALIAGAWLHEKLKKHKPRRDAHA